MTKKRPFAFEPKGATILEGGHYTGPVTGNFKVFYVTDGNGVQFRRCPYTPGGWKVAKNRRNDENKPVWYSVKAKVDLIRLNQLVGVKPYAGYRQTVAEDF